MQSTAVRLMTVEEFRRVPEPAGDWAYELHHGELVQVSRPKLRHVLLQERLRDLIKDLAEGMGAVMVELPFRALPEHELRAADVGFVSAERLAAADPDSDLMGAPDLVIEVLSPSNSAQQMLDKLTLCLENGCLEFWMADDKLRIVQVTHASGMTKTYRVGDRIPLKVLPGKSLSVERIFSLT